MPQTFPNPQAASCDLSVDCQKRQRSVAPSMGDNQGGVPLKCRQGSRDYWAAVKQLGLSDYKKETLLLTIPTLR